MENSIDDKIIGLNDEFIIISKTKDDILDELDFNDEEERLLCDSIITGLEQYVADTVRSMKVAQIPFIGCLRINPIKRKLRDAKLHLSAVRKNLTKEQYKEHVRSYVIDLKEQQAKEDRFKFNIIRLKRINKKKYEELFKKCGKSYAELYIKSIYWLKEVPYSQEFEDRYRELK